MYSWHTVNRYTRALRNNDYTVQMQRQNIARTIQRQEEGKPAVGTQPSR